MHKTSKNRQFHGQVASCALHGTTKPNCQMQPVLYNNFSRCALQSAPPYWLPISNFNIPPTFPPSMDPLSCLRSAERKVPNCFHVEGTFVFVRHLSVIVCPPVLVVICLSLVSTPAMSFQVFHMP